MLCKIFTNDYMSYMDEKFKDNTLHELFENGIFNDPEEETMDYEISDTDDSSLVLSTDKDDTLNNAIKLYETYRLTKIQASNRGFWTYLSLHKFGEFNKKQYPLTEKNITSEHTIHDHYIMSASATGIMRHTLAGLWWGVYLTIDENRKDPYELTKILFRQKTFYSRFFSTNILSIKAAVQGVLEFMLQNEELFSTGFEHRMRAVSIIINRLAGTKLIAAMDRDFFLEELNKRKELIKKADSRKAILELF